MEDIFNGHGIEIEIKEKDDFLKIRETLTRMGVSSRKENKLFQSCHILHKRGRYAILHFKELFLMDGLQSDITDNDVRTKKYHCWVVGRMGFVGDIRRGTMMILCQSKFSSDKNYSSQRKGGMGIDSKIPYR